MRIIGVTGGIGSGKSTVSRILSNYRATIIDADTIAKQVVSKGEKALEELVGYFGGEILTKDLQLDRKKLADVVFNNSKSLEILNEITHKYIVERIIKTVEKEKEEKACDLLVIDVPIPVEHGFLDLADEIWVVWADEETRVKRIIERSGLTYDEALRRINSQKSDQEYFRIADYIIVNNRSIEALEKKIIRLIGH